MHFSVGDFIIDLVDNSLEAGANLVEVEILESNEEISVTLRDNGTGMDRELLSRIRDPYFTDGIKHPGRKVGLGIPFLIHAAEQCGGDFRIESVPGKGTEVFFSFPADNIDTPPVGDLAETFAGAVLKPTEYEAVLLHRVRDSSGERSYRVTRSELTDALGELESVASQNLVRRYMASHEEEIQGKEK
ncbi:ATP-binding protein [Marispirochaeta aestuarii]|uniref:ATP-binding protein n=1 Tax=Marispirochaeta aestuarii TaxID=1963862 RepID=UPI0029C91E6A|nr:ATP-binding protein [Marispirochaeta aestuarii]